MTKVPTKRSPQEQDDRILAAYEAWDPTAEPLQVLAGRLGVSRSTIYNALDRNGVTPKGRRPDPDAVSTPERGDELLERMAAMALDRLLDDVASNRRWQASAVEVLRKYLDDPEVARLLADRP